MNTYEDKALWDKDARNEDFLSQEDINPKKEQESEFSKNNKESASWNAFYECIQRALDSMNKIKK